MNKICIIIPYFGKFPNYFDFWLKSAEFNSHIDFLIFTDNVSYQSEKNIKFIYMSFQDFKDLLQKEIEFPICLDEPYKICDYRPVFGSALRSYISEYTFWGFGDVDLILGDLSQFLTSDILRKYDKIYNLGHLTLLRNNSFCNNLWKTIHHIKKAYRYDEAFKTPYPCHFDETDGLTPIAKIKGVKTYTNPDFADIDRRNFNFLMLGKEDTMHPGVFEWKKGKLNYLYKQNDEVISQEVAYAHFQKRKLTIQNKSSIASIEKFVIEPNTILTNYQLDKILNNQKIVDEYDYYKTSRRNEIIGNIKKHAIQQRLYRLFLMKINRKRLDRTTK